MTLPLAVYGTLRTGGGAQAVLGIEGRLDDLGPCLIPGRLMDLGRYPGLLPGEGRVRGDLFSFPDDEALALIDWWEDYMAEDEPASLYLRRTVRLIEPAGMEAVVYYWNGPHHVGLREVAGGDWLA